MKNRSQIVLAVIFIVLGVSVRFAPHVWNFAPVAAIALAASAYLGLAYSVAIIFAIMILSDISLGFYEWQIMLAVYASFLASALIGLALRKNKTVLKIAGASIASSLVFFFATNFAVWQFSGMYSNTFAGLEACFIAALPFFRGTFFGDLFFSAFFFTVFEFALRFVSSQSSKKISVTY